MVVKKKISGRVVMMNWAAAIVDCDGGESCGGSEKLHQVKTPSET